VRKGVKQVDFRVKKKVVAPYSHLLSRPAGIALFFFTMIEVGNIFSLQQHKMAMEDWSIVERFKFRVVC
jgi:hypothetical protein